MGVPALRELTCHNPECKRKFTGHYPKFKKFCPDCATEFQALTGRLSHPPDPPPSAGDSETEVRTKLLLQKNKAMSGEELADALDCGPTKAKQTIESMMARGFAISRRADGKYELISEVAPGGQTTVSPKDRGDGWHVAGLTADNHLCSKHERLDVLNTLYDIWEREGVTEVYNGGNWIEGESRLNKHDVKVFGMGKQADYMVDNWPTRKGMKMYFVAGNDHEGWYTIREAVNIGQFIEDRAKRAGREDLVYLGNIEADVKLQHGGGSAVMRVQHGGGGNAYALSYVLQKTVESLQGGEKPSLLVVGHHHKFCYIYPRNVHAIMPGCTEDQSIFMRTRKIEAHVGGVLIRYKQDKADGHITEFECRWIPFYDRGFYERRFEI